MSEKQTVCDPRRIELFLEQQLSDDEQAAFAEHLSACETCRRALDAAAADAGAWLEARESLGSDDSFASQPDEREASSEDEVTDEGPLLRRDSPPLSMLGPTDDPRMLGRLGTYEIAGVIGRGGMGWVLKGFDAALNRYVAIKVLAPHLAASGSARKRFDREAKAAAAVVHDNVISIHSVAEWNGLPYLVMPYIPGESLEKRLGRQGPLAVTEVLRIGVQMASGLAAAHAQGLVHRDIKPANILLELGVERLKITDFGLARAVDDASLTRTGVIAGTPQYMSPEQARGESIDARSDLFSLGSVLYAASTGRPPFRAETTFGILRRITDSEPRPVREINPEIPTWLAAIISRLHAKDPAARFQSAEEVADLLGKCLAHVQQPTVVPLPEAAVTEPACERSVPKRPRRARPRPARSIVIAAVAVTVLLVGILWATLAGRNKSAGDANSGQSGKATLSLPAVASEVQQTTGDATKSQWRDGVAEEISDVTGKIDELQRQSQQLWGDANQHVPKENSQ
jgi:serine/threonine protein kinase